MNVLFSLDLLYAGAFLLWWTVNSPFLYFGHRSTATSSPLGFFHESTVRIHIIMQHCKEHSENVQRSEEWGGSQAWQLSQKHLISKNLSA